MRYNHYQLPRTVVQFRPNWWDVLVLVLVFAVLAALAWGALQMQLPYQLGAPMLIKLDIAALPGYAINTMIRMLMALCLSLLVTCIMAPLMAKNRTIERCMLPLIDVLQSLPVLGILSLSVTSFIRLFPNSLLGPECAAIFAVFTAQVWNILLSMYQSIRSIPNALIEAVKMYQLSAWQRFWRLELPFSAPGLLWNVMMSMSGSWFFIVLSEAFSVAGQKITLPGLGSYIHQAIELRNMPALGYACITMLIVIVGYDQLCFRPILVWLDKFQATDAGNEPESWFFNVLTKTRMLQAVETAMDWLSDLLRNSPQRYWQRYRTTYTFPKVLSRVHLNLPLLIKAGIFFSLCCGIFIIWKVIQQELTTLEVFHVIHLGFITAIKIMILICIASIIWVPLGIYIGMHHRLSKILQPLIQILAAFPANLFYPIVVIAIVKFKLNHNIWTSPLMILGTQWYILFNVIAGSMSIPQELKLAIKNFGVSGWLWWKRLALPAIFPYYVTGAITAMGGSWNASIVSEAVEWGPWRFISLGLGGYITEKTQQGDFTRIVLGISVMAIYVLVFNHFFWQKLYAIAKNRFVIEA
jgi:NitT/TauT family transport system permease protein